MKTFSLLALLIMACIFPVSCQPAKEVPAGMIFFDLNKTTKGGISGTIIMPGDLKGFLKSKGNSVSLSGKTIINL